MTNNEIRVAIAKSQGWRELGLTCYGIPPNAITPEITPNYPSDLNAMHEVEKTLPEEDWERYCNALTYICCGNNVWNNPYHGWIANHKLLGDNLSTAINATARQRAEAYLRVKGLWKD